jgi:hypothetical protein
MQSTGEGEGVREVGVRQPSGMSAGRWRWRRQAEGVGEGGVEEGNGISKEKA